jgi:hypothetical protein
MGSSGVHASDSFVAISSSKSFPVNASQHVGAGGGSFQECGKHLHSQNRRPDNTSTRRRRQGEANLLADCFMNAFVLAKIV